MPPVMGPFPPIAAPPMLGVAPPPVGPRLPDPRAIADLKAGIAKLLDAAEKDPVVAKALNPIIQSLIQARAKLLEPPKPADEEAEDVDSGPLDRSPAGEGATGGTPILSALPRLMGLGAR